MPNAIFSIIIISDKLGASLNRRVGVIVLRTVVRRTTSRLSFSIERAGDEFVLEIDR